MSDRQRRILILGGYGTFGGRLAELLARDGRLTVLIAGHLLDKARAFCSHLPEGAERVALAFDREGDLDAQLAMAAPDIVVDASGPFQAYAGDVYKLVRAAVARGVDYMDLADSSEFVAGVGAFDAEARAKGVYALAGVSSFPVLTAAAVHLPAHCGRSAASRRSPPASPPSPHARVGLNVIRSHRELCRPESGVDARRRASVRSAAD